MTVLKTGDLVVYQNRPYVYLGESMNGEHAIIGSNYFGSTRISLSHSQIRPLYLPAGFDSPTRELEAAFEFSEAIKRKHGME